MENKKLLTKKILHLILAVAGIIIYAAWLIFFNQGTRLIDNLYFIASIIALAASLIYLMKDYKKSSHMFYKAFLWFLGISEILRYTSVFSQGATFTPFRAFIWVMTLVAYIFIIGAKDYGKVKSNIVSSTLVILNLYPLIVCITTMRDFEGFNPYLFDAIGQLIIALITAIMVCVKYIDKTERGTN